MIAFFVVLGVLAVLAAGARYAYRKHRQREETLRRVTGQRVRLRWVPAESANVNTWLVGTATIAHLDESRGIVKLDALRIERSPFPADSWQHRQYEENGIPVVNVRTLEILDTGERFRW